MNQIQNEFSISPNPVQHQAKILSQNYLNGAEIRVVNLMGQIERHYSYIIGNEITLDFEGIRSGIYFIQISDNNFTEEVRIMVIE
jgi:hypothetical protein